MSERVRDVEPPGPRIHRRPALQRAADADGAASFANVLPDRLASKRRRVLSQIFNAVLFVAHATVQRRPSHPRRQLARVNSRGSELMRVLKEVLDMTKPRLV